MLLDPIKMSLQELFLDPNNPRLAPEKRNYSDAERLFNTDEQEKLSASILGETHGLDDLVEVIVQQGWVPVDQIIVWKHPQKPNHSVVVEGNRRTTALKHIHSKIFQKAEKDFLKFQAKKEDHPERFEEAKQYFEKVKKVVEDTTVLTVVPMAASSHEELLRDLPRVLAVRHINRARDWGGYPTDRWLLSQYKEYEKSSSEPTHPWDQKLVNEVANEASINHVDCKKRLRAASLYEDFVACWEDDLPDGEEFKDTDYYLFELISQVAWFRDKVLGLGLDSRTFSNEASQAIFEWVFKKPRGRTADDNSNKFYRHENVRLLNTIRKYDEDHDTAFTTPFTLEDYLTVPRVQEVEARYLQHKNQQGSDTLLRSLIDALDDMKMGEARNQGEYIIKQLERLEQVVNEHLRMVRANNG